MGFEFVTVVSSYSRTDFCQLLLDLVLLSCLVQNVLKAEWGRNSTMFSRASMSEKSLSNSGTHGENLSVHLEAIYFYFFKFFFSTQGYRFSSLKVW
jgi:hypothetical protein